MKCIELLLIIFFHQSRSNMETTHLSSIIDTMQKSLNRNIPKTSITTKLHPTGPTTANIRPEFLQSVEKKILMVRSKIGEAMDKATKVGDAEYLTSIQMNMLRIISSKLTILNREYLYLLDEGILTLYMDICELIKSCNKTKIRITIKNLLKDISHSFKVLLIDHFVYQQYLHRKQNKNRKKEGLSYGGNKDDASQLPLAQQALLIGQIQKEINATPIHQLVKKQVKNQQKKMKEAVQVCRICFHKILLSNVESHVRKCQKQNTLKQNIQEKNYELAHLKSQLKRRSEQINLSEDFSQYKEDFKLISRIVLTSERKEKNMDRRCSLMGVRSEKHIGDNLEKLIEDFIQTHGEEPLLKKILSVYKEKVYLEKKVNQIEIHSIHNHENSPYNNKQNPLFHLAQNSPHKPRSKINRFTSLANEIEDDKSIRKKDIDKVDEDKNSINSAEKSESQNQEENIDTASIKLLKSKKILSKKVVKSDQFQQIYKYRRYSSLQAFVEDTNKQEISLNNFQILKPLGQGAFGKVYMVRRKETRDIYALKIIKIPENNVETSLQSIKREHQIFKKIAGKHLVKAPFSFSEKSCHIFILEYLPGGDLRRLLNQQVYLDEQRAKVYLAEIILAIEHLHHSNIIHRDLKPENLVFDRLGHLKLTDFGLSQFQMEQKLLKSRKQYVQRESSRRTRRRREAVLSNNKQKMKLIGTPDYIAPQIIFKTSLSNFSIDWWSLGVMAYELMIGTRPFCAETIEQVIDNITNFNIEWPEIGTQQGMMSPQAKDLICQLLNKDFMHRLGANGADQIKSHQFFANISWDTIKTEKPLIVPKITNVRECIEIQEDIALKKEIAQFLEKGQRKRTVDLQKFIRFDLLGSETIENFHKIHEQQSKKLNTLKQLQQTFLTQENLQTSQQQ